MNDIDIKLNADELVGLLSKKKGLGDLVTSILNQVLEHQMQSHIGAGRYEQSEERQGYRNGYRARQLYTRIGQLTLRVPQTRDGSFCTEIFKRYQRHEQAFALGLMEMYLQGVSTRKVTKITERLCGVTFSKSTVSQLCVHLDARLKAWRKRSLSDKRYPFLIVDALVVDVRRDDAVRATGCLVAYRVNEEGMREPLDLLIADSETQNSWASLFSNLKERGLNGVELVVSDNHAGLVGSVKKHFQGAVWQRCQVHFMRNILGLSARHLRKALASRLSLVFKAEDKATARKLAHDIQEDYSAKACKGMECFDRGLEDAIAVLAYPARYQKRLRTSNLAERVNEEIRRRQRVIRILPNEAAAERLIGAWLADLHDQWQASGCGWGSFTLYAANKFPDSQFTAVSNSSTQKKYIDDMASKHRLKNVITLTEDVNNLQLNEKYDCVVSIEMFEHVRNYQHLLEKISSWLSPEGKLFIHHFCHQYLTHPFNAEDSWMAKHFFKNGLMPSEDLLLFFNDQLVIDSRWRVNGKHYAKTCYHWLENLYQNKSETLSLFNNHYDNPKLQYEYWDLFIRACAQLFSFNSRNEWFVTHYLFKKR